MEYHEIGERFEYNGVMLEVVKRDNCEDCFFHYGVECAGTSWMSCGSCLRKDDTLSFTNSLNNVKQNIWSN